MQRSQHASMCAYNFAEPMNTHSYIYVCVCVITRVNVEYEGFRVLDYLSTKYKIYVCVCVCVITRTM